MLKQGKAGYQPRNTPAERRAFFDLERQLKELPTDADLASYATTAYVNARTPHVRYKSTGGLASYAAGDTLIPVTGGTTNIGGWTISSGQLIVPKAGTYAIGFTFGTNVHGAGAAVAVGAGGITTAFPCQGGTGWRTGGTVTATCALASGISFTYRCVGATVTQALTTEIILLADW